MRTVFLLIAVILLTFFGCGNQNNQNKSPEENETEVETPKLDLHAAVVMDNLDVIRKHIKAGSDLNFPEPTHSSSPLITAAALGKTEATKILVDAGADLNYQNADGSTALHTAAVFGYTEIANLLIDAGTDLSILNNDGSTALHTAVPQANRSKGLCSAVPEDAVHDRRRAILEQHTAASVISRISRDRAVREPGRTIVAVDTASILSPIPRNRAVRQHDS